MVIAIGGMAGARLQVVEVGVFKIDDRLDLGCVDLRFGDGLDGRRQIGGNATTSLQSSATDCRGRLTLQG